MIRSLPGEATDDRGERLEHVAADDHVGEPEPFTAGEEVLDDLVDAADEGEGGVGDHVVVDRDHSGNGSDGSRPVLGDGGEINLEAGTVEIDLQGGVYVDGDEVGRLQITDFTNPETLIKAGNGRFVGSEGTISTEFPENTTLSQGYLETANINPVQAMTEMIETSRAFEAYQKVIQSADEATSKSINDVGKTI